MTHERVVLLDDDANPIGTAPKSSVHGLQTPLHLAFSCYVFDEDGRFLATQRSLHKSTFPGVWTNSCCGHPQPGEDPGVSVRRRLLDELGIDRVMSLRLVLPSFRYRAVMDNGMVENEICPVYAALVPAGTECRVDANEVADHRWLPFRTSWDWRQDPSVTVSPWVLLQLEQLGQDFAYAGEVAAPCPQPVDKMQGTGGDTVPST